MCKRLALALVGVICFAVAWVFHISAGQRVAAPALERTFIILFACAFVLFGAYCIVAALVAGRDSVNRIVNEFFSGL
jgi:hypothetical protein